MTTALAGCTPAMRPLGAALAAAAAHAVSMPQERTMPYCFCEAYINGADESMSRLCQVSTRWPLMFKRGVSAVLPSLVYQVQCRWRCADRLPTMT